MIAGVDSSFTVPSAAQLAAAKAAGVAVWSGYIQSKANVGLARAWSQADFARVRAAGLNSIGYCSGRDDPVALRALAAAWGVLLCLDVEGSIRADGPWVQQWLDDAGCGLYGNAPVHNGRRARFHVLAAYPGRDPRATWSGTRPAAPCSWQWQGTSSAFGVSVDLAWHDDWFALNAPQPPPQPPILSEDDPVQVFIVVDKATNAAYWANGTWVRHLVSAQAVTDAEWVATNMLKRPAITVSPGPPLAYGAPQNAETAKLLGVAFP